jgi:hypothetical protein
MTFMRETAVFAKGGFKVGLTDNQGTGGNDGQRRDCGGGLKEKPKGGRLIRKST